jgi:hypothetical protein
MVIGEQRFLPICKKFKSISVDVRASLPVPVHQGTFVGKRKSTTFYQIDGEQENVSKAYEILSGDRPVATFPKAEIPCKSAEALSKTERDNLNEEAEENSNKLAVTAATPPTERKMKRESLESAHQQKLKDNDIFSDSISRQIDATPLSPGLTGEPESDSAEEEDPISSSPSDADSWAPESPPKQGKRAADSASSAAPRGKKPRKNTASGDGAGPDDGSARMTKKEEKMSEALVSSMERAFRGQMVYSSRVRSGASLPLHYVRDNISLAAVRAAFPSVEFTTKKSGVTTGELDCSEVDASKFLRYSGYMTVSANVALRHSGKCFMAKSRYSLLR